MSYIINSTDIFEYFNHIEIPYIAILIILLIIIIYIYKFYSISNDKCYKYNDSDKNILRSKDEETEGLNKVFIKSSFNSCCIGDSKYDYVNLCALDNCYNNGVRCLDFQIFSLENEPIISSSTSSSFEYKELFNHLSFTETMIYIKNKFIAGYDEINNEYPLFLNFRIFTNDIIVINKMNKYLKDIFNYKIYIKNDDDQNGIKKKYNFINKTINELKNKVIIMIDTGSNAENIKDIENSDLDDIISIKFGSSNYYSSTSNNIQTINYDDSLSAVFPKNNSKAINYDISQAMSNHYRFIFMNFQTNDKNLKRYKKKFKGQSFLKDENI